MLDVRRMRVLREVAAQGSFSAAAEALSFTQSAVSQQVAALEREAGAKLVERRARGIRLTPAGEALVLHADLADEDWFNSCPGTSCDQVVLGACRAAGFDPRVVVECDENEQMQAFVAGGLGVALWPHLALAHVRPGVAVKPVSGAPVKRRVHAATLAGAYRSAATEAMLAILRATAEEFTLTAPLRVA